jgi:hypothetical protein
MSYYVVLAPSFNRNARNSPQTAHSVCGESGTRSVPATVIAEVTLRSVPCRRFLLPPSHARGLSAIMRRRRRKGRKTNQRPIEPDRVARCCTRFGLRPGLASRQECFYGHLAAIEGPDRYGTRVVTPRCRDICNRTFDTGWGKYHFPLRKR